MSLPLPSHLPGKHYDPCIDSETEAYLNRRDVQLALHANVSGELPGPWTDCTQKIQYKRCAVLCHAVLRCAMPCCAVMAEAWHAALLQTHAASAPPTAGATCCAPSCRSTAS